MDAKNNAPTVGDVMLEIREWYREFPFQGRHETREEHSKRATEWYHSLRNKYPLAGAVLHTK